MVNQVYLRLPSTDRRMLLNSVLLCAAADGGVVDDVARLLTEAISPNVRGLRHRSALHCAASSNQLEVVRLLLMNGVREFALGGRMFWVGT